MHYTSRRVKKDHIFQMANLSWVVFFTLSWMEFLAWRHPIHSCVAKVHIFSCVKSEPHWIAYLVCRTAKNRSRRVFWCIQRQVELLRMSVDSADKPRNGMGVMKQTVFSTCLGLSAASRRCIIMTEKDIHFTQQSNWTLYLSCICLLLLALISLSKNTALIGMRIQSSE
jgi:uncharacterized membrane protein